MVGVCAWVVASAADQVEAARVILPMVGVWCTTASEDGGVHIADVCTVKEHFAASHLTGLYKRVG